MSYCFDLAGNATATGWRVCVYSRGPLPAALMVRPGVPHEGEWNARQLAAGSVG
jgi:hypothetical protein